MVPCEHISLSLSPSKGSVQLGGCYIFDHIRILSAKLGTEHPKLQQLSQDQTMLDPNLLRFLVDLVGPTWAGKMQAIVSCCQGNMVVLYFYSATVAPCCPCENVYSTQVVPRSVSLYSIQIYSIFQHDTPFLSPSGKPGSSNLPVFLDSWKKKCFFRSFSLTVLADRVTSERSGSASQLLYLLAVLTCEMIL